MQGIAMTRERTDLEPAIRDEHLKMPQLASVREEHVRIAVRLPDPSAGPELDGLHAVLRRQVEHALERLIGHHHGEETELHGFVPIPGRTVVSIRSVFFIAVFRNPTS
jgi:hypothetical protein